MTNDNPENPVETSIGVNLRVTAHSTQGGRKYMEDMFCVAYQPTADERDLLYAYFGIFDGHGGKEAALYAKQHLMDEIVSQKNFWSDDDSLILKAIRDGFINTHFAMWKELERWPKTPSGLPSTSGTTASIAFVRRGKLYIGHVGDSAITLGYQDPGTGFWKATPLTKDHKPEGAAENARITKCGGKVINKSGVPRVVWNRPRIGHKGPVRRSTTIDEIPFLAVARSLGDLWSYNSAQDEFVVSPVPDVSVIDIDVESHRCLILGSDGLWNMLNAQDAVNSVYFAEKNNERQLLASPSEVSTSQVKNWINPSKRLVDRALDRWYHHNLRADNTSVVTVVIDPPGPPKAQVIRQNQKNYEVRESISSVTDPATSKTVKAMILAPTQGQGKQATATPTTSIPSAQPSKNPAPVVRNQPSSSVVRGQQSSSAVRGQPNSSMVRSQPSSSAVRGQPSSSEVRGQTSSSAVRGQPSSSVVRSQPSSSAVRGQPSSSVVRSQPSSSAVRGQPSSSVVRSQPSSSAVRGQPSSSAVRSQPSSSAVRDQPSGSRSVQASRILPAPVTSSRRVVASTNLYQSNLIQTNPTKTNTILPGQSRSDHPSSSVRLTKSVPQKRKYDDVSAPRVSGLSSTPHVAQPSSSRILNRSSARNVVQNDREKVGAMVDDVQIHEISSSSESESAKPPVVAQPRRASEIPNKRPKVLKKKVPPVKRTRSERVKPVEQRNPINHPQSTSPMRTRSAWPRNSLVARIRNTPVKKQSIPIKKSQPHTPKSQNLVKTNPNPKKSGQSGGPSTKTDVVKAGRSLRSSKSTVTSNVKVIITRSKTIGNVGKKRS